MLRDESNMVNLRNHWKVKLEPRVQREEVSLGNKVGRAL